jgi:hypothetical protein
MDVVVADKVEALKGRKDGPSHSPSLGIRMTFQGYILSCGKKGLKAHGVKVAGKR